MSGTWRPLLEWFELFSVPREANALGIRGKDVAPFLLAEIVKATKGRSLRANIATVKNNAKVAEEIAKAYVARSPGPETSACKSENLL